MPTDMSRSARPHTAGIGLLAAGALLLLAPLAGATSPPFTATPSYAPYGGLPHVGHFVIQATGSGSNHIGVAPTFGVATGIGRSAQRSESVGLGTYSIEVWTGVENVSFSCTITCTTGNHSVTLLWNLTWTAHVNSTCPAPATHVWVHASVLLNLSALVLDFATSPPSVAAINSVPIWAHVITTPVSHSYGTNHLYTEKFPVPLVKGDHYTILGYVLATTYAASVAGAACGSGAIATIGSTSHPSVLDEIKIA